MMHLNLLAPVVFPHRAANPPLAALIFAGLRLHAAQRIRLHPPVVILRRDAERPPLVYTYCARCYQLTMHRDGASCVDCETLGR